MPPLATREPVERTPTKPAQVNAPRSALRRWLREPLLHFLLIGAVLFAFYHWRNREPAADSRQIVLTDDDLLQLVVTWRAQGRPDPDAAQMQTLLEAKIREEVLYREALGMGLDKNDTIVKRRMAQKMDFLAEDLSTLREPTREELQAWLKTHPEDFMLPPRITFQHLYFSFDRHHEQTREAAASAFEKAKGLAPNSPEAAALGERFMFQDAYAERTPEEVGSVFGDKFARALFEQKPGAWSGPIESGFGWHLVFINSLTPGRLPEFEEIEAEVKAQWVANQRAEFKREAYRVMRQKYQVILPAKPAKDATAKNPLPKKGGT